MAIYFLYDTERTEKDKAFIVYPDDCQLCHICENLFPAKGAITLSSHKCGRPMTGWG